MHDYEVETPHYPDINHEPINTFLPKIMESHTFTADTILVGHSAGAPLILSILENLDQPILFSALICGYSMRLPGEAIDPVLQESYNWQKIKQNSNDFAFINSVDDPWGCDDAQGRVMFDRLGGTQIIKNDGHFGSEGKNVPYTEFPLLRDLILEAVT